MADGCTSEEVGPLGNPKKERAFHGDHIHGEV